MRQRITMSESIEFFNLSMAESREYFGLDRGDKTQKRFDSLIEAAWDLGCIGVSEEEFNDTVVEHEFYLNTYHGLNVWHMARSMYERSVELHKKTEAIV